MPTFTTQQIAQHVGGELAGPDSAAVPIHGVEQVEFAQPGQLTFIGDEKYARLWPQCRASAALVSHQIAAQVAGRDGAAIILVKSADLAMAAVLELFTPPLPVGGLAASGVIHPTAFVDPTANIGEGVRIGAHCVVGPRVVIGARTILYPHVTLLDDTTLGEGCVIWPGVVIRERCTLGHRCIMHPNVSIGADGFGYRPGGPSQGLIKIPQIGTVEIGNDVEIGANSCVDRGKFSATIIGDGCKIDNICQIGHNCRLGKHVIIAGRAGISGSVTIGDGAMIGGGAGISDHVTIAPGGIVMAAAGVMRDVLPGERVVGTPARDSRQFFRETAALAKLPELIKQIRKANE